MKHSLVFLSLLALPASAAVVIDYVTVGNAGNAADSTGYGAVANEYKIAKNETTLAQYAEFLNATAATDSYGLYSTSMASDTDIAGITRSGSSGSYTYSVTGSGVRPVTYVSWFDAARFVNWMQNGQGSGSTETGVYNLNGATSGIFTAQVGAMIWLPTEDEWYKAAYYDPTKNAGMGGYWLRANQSDTITSNTIRVAGAANFHDGNYAKDQNALPSYLTDVGAYGTNSDSYYGTNDQAGNVWEWNDAVIPDDSGDSRGLRGGSWDTMFEIYLRSSSRTNYEPSSQDTSVGFRVASVPEPTSLVLTMLFGSLCATRRKR